MKKLPHEMLRDGADLAEKEKCLYNFSIGNRYIASPTAKEARRIADVFEKYYSPIPRDPEGNPVHKDMEVEGGVVKHWSVSEDGSWTIFDDDYEEIQCGDKNEPIRLPKPKAPDADGVPCKKGETVWNLADSTKWEIIDIHPTEPRITVRQLDIDKDVSGGWFLACEYSHREPDSLEKLRDEMIRWTYNPARPGEAVKQWANRLTAIMERDADGN